MELTSAIEPKTPVSQGETRESLYDINYPLTSVIDPAKFPCVSVASSKKRLVDFFDPVTESSPPPQTPSDPVAQSSAPCKTPESAVYDSSAPAPDGMFKNHSKHFKYLNPRRISFDSDEEDEVKNEKNSPNKEIIKFVSRTASQILSNQVGGSLDQDEVARVNGDDSDYGDDSGGYTTPSTPPTRTLTGVSETCPSPPSRRVNRTRNIDLESCRDGGLVRRVDFDSD